MACLAVSIRSAVFVGKPGEKTPKKERKKERKKKTK
jgi:hypothetical protein